MNLRDGFPYNFASFSRSELRATSRAIKQNSGNDRELKSQVTIITAAPVQAAAQQVHLVRYPAPFDRWAQYRLARLAEQG